MRWLSPELHRLLGLLRPNRGRAFAGIALALVAVLAGIGLMALSGWFIAAMALAGAAGAAINYYTPAAAIRAFAIARTGGRYAERLATHDATLRTLASLRAWLFRRLIPLAPARLAALRSAELFARLRADVDRLEQFYLAVLIPLLVAAVGGILLLLACVALLPWATPWVLALLVLAGWGIPLWVRRRTAAAAAASVVEAGVLRGTLLDTLQGHAELLAWGGARAYAACSAACDVRLAAHLRQIENTEAVGAGLIGLLTQFGVAVVLACGLAAVRGGALRATWLVLLVFLVLGVFELLATLPGALAGWQATRIAARRVFELADAEPAVAEPAVSAPIAAAPAIRFCAVRMRYAADAPWALDGLDLDLAAGTRLALVGPSGAGKSSLLAALQKFQPIEAGQILFGGAPLDALRGDDLRRHIAVIAQHTTLFNTSLLDNLLLANPTADATAIEQAVHAAQLDAFVAGLPLGYDTPLGEGGALVSGGEARRIAIARALLQDAPVLVLDEPTEGLDAATAARLYDALAAATRGRSVLLVTHRLGGLATLVDQVAVMRSGQIVGQLEVSRYMARYRAGSTAMMPLRR